MKYAHYDATNNKLLGFYDDGFHETIPEPKVEITEEVWLDALKRNAQCVSLDGSNFTVKDYDTVEEKTLLVRSGRDSLLTELDGIVSNPVRYASFSDSLKQALADYRQLLLDLPQQPGFPMDVVWPIRPEVV